MGKRKWNLYYMNDYEIIAATTKAMAIEYSNFVVGPEETEECFGGLVPKDVMCKIPLGNLSSEELSLIQGMFAITLMGNSFMINAYDWLDFLLHVEDVKEKAFIILSSLD